MIIIPAYIGICHTSSSFGSVVSPVVLIVEGDIDDVAGVPVDGVVENEVIVDEVEFSASCVSFVVVSVETVVVVDVWYSALGDGLVTLEASDAVWFDEIGDGLVVS